MQTLTMRPGTVCPAYIFGNTIKANSGQTLASFDSHTRAYRALAIADGCARFPDWASTMTANELQQVLAVNNFLASQPEFQY